MPFDVHNFPDASRLDRAATLQSRAMVAVWLFSVAAMILVMIVLGGATRLTGSGLSIMEWAPLMGVLPPMSDNEWRRLFALYQQIPQYSLVNSGMGLDDFRHIFWLEWTHRLWGRLIGLTFIIPLVCFWATARIERSLLPKLAVLLALGALQGGVGWFMVSSGFFPDATAVSPGRLVIHLVLALVLYGAIVWTGLSLIRPPHRRQRGQSGVRVLALASLAAVALTIVAGGFVAGTHAGLIFNTFPLMDGRLVPDGYTDLQPFLRNLTENVAAVQFDHRLLATLSLLLVSALVVLGLRGALPIALALGLLMTILLQYALGVTTLLLAVPVSAGTAHQAGAVVLLTVLLAVVHHLGGRLETSPAPPPDHAGSRAAPRGSQSS